MSIWLGPSAFECVMTRFTIPLHRPGTGFRSGSRRASFSLAMTDRRTTGSCRAVFRWPRPRRSGPASSPTGLGIGRGLVPLARRRSRTGAVSSIEFPACLLQPRPHLDHGVEDSVLDRHVLFGLDRLAQRHHDADRLGRSDRRQDLDEPEPEARVLRLEQGLGQGPDRRGVLGLKGGSRLAADRIFLADEQADQPVLRGADRRDRPRHGVGFRRRLLHVHAKTPVPARVERQLSRAERRFSYLTGTSGRANEADRLPESMQRFSGGPLAGGGQPGMDAAGDAADGDSLPGKSVEIGRGPAAPGGSCRPARGRGLNHPEQCSGELDQRPQLSHGLGGRLPCRPHARGQSGDIPGGLLDEVSGRIEPTDRRR